MNTRQKMYKTNALIQSYLREHGWTNIYMFPHLRFMKDYYIEDCGFDGFAFKWGVPWFFQCKTNQKPPKETINKYKKFEDKYHIKCLWISKPKGKQTVELYSTITI